MTWIALTHLFMRSFVSTAEIDKTLKKISGEAMKAADLAYLCEPMLISLSISSSAEGILEFEGIHEKLQSASTPSQSAKYESELKTSIKRLQRHR